jgi:hypothetical protein
VRFSTLLRGGQKLLGMLVAGSTSCLSSFRPATQLTLLSMLATYPRPYMSARDDILAWTSPDNTLGSMEPKGQQSCGRAAGILKGCRTISGLADRFPRAEFSVSRTSGISWMT